MITYWYAKRSGALWIEGAGLTIAGPRSRLVVVRPLVVWRTGTGRAAGEQCWRLGLGRWTGCDRFRGFSRECGSPAVPSVRTYRGPALHRARPLWLSWLLRGLCHAGAPQLQLTSCLVDWNALVVRSLTDTCEIAQSCNWQLAHA